MADKLVMRWWPADTRAGWVRPSDYPGVVGIALQVTDNYTHATMAAPESDYHDLQQVSLLGGMASVVEFADPTRTLQVGEYIEHEIFLIQPDGVTVAPFSVAQLPMDVIIAGVGANPYQSWPEFAWRASRPVVGSYAGGVIEVGVYRNDEYTSLLSVWVSGIHFQTKEDGTSWDNPALPGNSDTAWLDIDTGLLWATLDGDFPIAPFWTGFKNAVEVNIKAEPEPEPEPEGQYIDLVMVAGPGDYAFNAVGFIWSRSGSVTPEHPVVSGISTGVWWLAYSLDDEALAVELGDVYGATGASLSIEGVGDFPLTIMTDYEYGLFASIALGESPFVDGQTYNIRLYLEGDLRSEP